MNKIHLRFVTACLALFLAGAAYAHDPSEHAHEQEAPNCAAMKDMKHMDMDDPVMIAMMRQCEDHHEDKHGHEEGGKAHGGHEDDHAKDHHH